MARSKKSRKRTSVRKPAKSTTKPKATATKHAGRWVCKRTGNTVICAGAKKRYPTVKGAKTAYARVKGVKGVKSFVSRYGKAATKKVVLGVKKNPDTAPAVASAPIVVGGTKANPRITKAQAAAIQAIMRRHGFGGARRRR